MNLGMNTMVLDINQGAWKLETERGVIMDGDKPEHPRSHSCDVAVAQRHHRRAGFYQFEDKEFDYQETILNQF